MTEKSLIQRAIREKVCEHILKYKPMNFLMLFSGATFPLHSRRTVDIF